MSTPAPTSLPTIYQAGDLVLQNPQETCAIFATVILISALLEYVLQRITSVENKYVRILVTTMTQEVTIIGVLSLSLMFAESVVPRKHLDGVYISLVRWANTCLFFMASIFVFVIVIQFLFAKFSMMYWKTFEEGKLDAEDVDAMRYHERLYKLCFERFRVALKAKANYTTAEVPFNEVIAAKLRRHLIVVSNLSFRTWLSLLFVVGLNFLRCYFTPWDTTSDDHLFNNAMMYVAVIGYGTFGVFLLFFLLLQSRLFRFGRGTLKCEEPSTLVPLGSVSRGMEFLQLVTMSIDWYFTIFITGNAREVLAISTGWKAALVFVLFALPGLAFVILLPWAFFSVSLLSAIGDLRLRDARRIAQRLKGEGGDESEGSDLSSEADDSQPSRRAGSTGGSRARTTSLIGTLRRTKSNLSASSKHSGADPVLTRPLWLQDDDDWDGEQTLLPGVEAAGGPRADTAFYRTLDPDVVRRAMLRRHEVAFAPLASAEQHRVAPPSKALNADVGSRGDSVKNVSMVGRRGRRPAWLDDDEPWDVELADGRGDSVR